MINKAKYWIWKRHKKHPHLFALTFIPFTTWAHHPIDGYLSYHAHVKDLLFYREVDKLHKLHK